MHRIKFPILESLNRPFQVTTTQESWAHWLDRAMLTGEVLGYHLDQSGDQAHPHLHNFSTVKMSRMCVQTLLKSALPTTNLRACLELFLNVWVLNFIYWIFIY